MEPNPKTPDSLDNPVDQGQIPVQPAVVTGNLDSPAVSEPPYQAPHPSFFRYNRTALLITAFALILIVLAGFGGLFLVRGGKGPTEANQSSVAQEGSYAVGSVNSPNLSDAVQLQLGQASSLAVNGQLQVNDNLVLAPTAAPDTPVTGEVYYDKTTNQPYYYNGAAFISLAPTATPEHVTTLGGAAGVIGLGDGLTVSGNQLSLAGSVLQAVADIPSSADVNAPRVSSLQGLTGAVTFTGGPGISINGTTITGTGVNTLTASTSNLVITHDADGNYSIADNSGGGGAGVVLGPASPQTDATNNPSISINKTGTADLLNLENNGTPVLTVSQNGAIASGAAGAVTGALELANSGSSKLATLESAALNQNTVYVLPDPGAASATICLSTGNCAGAGGGITGSGTTGDLAKFSGSGTITNSNLSESGSQLSYAGNLVVDAGGGFSGNVLNLEVNGSSKYSVDQTGNTIQAGTLTVNGTGGSTIAGTLTVGAGLTVTTGGLTVSAGDVTLGALGAGLVQSSAGGLLSSGAVDRNDNTYFSGTLSVANGGTGTGSFTSGGILYGGTGAIAATGSADNSVLATNGSGVPSLVQTLPLTVQGNITALGAVTSGSIGSGFGTISTGNNITTTAGLQGGTLTVTGGSFRVDASGNVVTTGTLAVQGSGGITIGVPGTTTGSLLLANSSNSHTVSLQGLAPSGQDETIIIPASTAATDEVCLETLGNCSGAGSSVASSGGNQYYIPVFSNVAATQITNSQLYNNSTGVSVGGSSPSALFNVGTSNQFQVSSAGGVTATGITSSGSIQFSGLNSAGVVHTNSLGQLSTSLVVLGTDTSGDYVADLGALTGLTTSGNSGAGSKPSLSVTYGSAADTAVQGGTQLVCASGSGNLTGGGNTITLGAGGTCSGLTVVDSPTFSGNLTVQGSIGITVGVASNTTGDLNLANAGSADLGTVQVAALGQSTTYILPDPDSSSATICLNTGNCAGAGNGITGSGTEDYLTKFNNAGGNQIGDSLLYDNGSGVSVGGTSPAGLFNVGSSNQFQVSSAGALQATGITSSGTIQFSGLNSVGVVHTNASGQLSTGKVVLGTDTSGNYVASLGAPTGLGVSGNSGAGSTPVLSVLYGDTADTAVQGSTAITCPAGTGNLTGGGNTITLGAGGACGDLTVVDSPTFAGTLTVQGTGGITVGVAGSTAGVVNLANASNAYLSQIEAAAPSGTSNAVYTLPAIASSDTICLQTLGNCSGSGGLTGSGTAGDILKYATSDTVTDSGLSEAGTTLTYAGNAVVNAATGFSGNLINLEVGTSSPTSEYSVNQAGNSIQAGTLTVNGTGASSVAGTLSVGTLGAAGTTVLCEAGGQLETCNSTAGSGNFIFNQSASAQTANFDIAATTGIAAQIKGDSASDILDLLTSGGSTVAQFTDVGNINLGSGGIASTIQIGNTTGAVAQTIDLGNNATASSTNTVTIGSTIGASTTTIQGGTGGINLTPNGLSNTGVLVKNTNNSSAAFQVQNAAGATVLTANTTSQNVTVGTVATSTGNPFASTNTQSLTTGTNPNGVTTGNLCNNGSSDLAVANTDSTTISIYCNTGSIGTPFSATATMTLTTGSGPEGITTGNLCDNGKVDIAVANYNASTIFVYCNTGSTGSSAFSATATMTLTTGSGGPVRLTTGNLCNNGRVDIAATDYYNSTLTVYCNTGSTGAAAFSTSPTMTLANGSGPEGITTGNLCDNGKVDIAVANYNASTIFVYCNTGSTGSSAFSSATIALNTSSDPMGITAGNLCNNGRSDLAVTNAGSATASIYCNTGSTGSSAFSATATQSLTTGTSPFGINTGNLCGNGKADLAVANAGSATASIYCNTGSTGSSAFSATATQSLTIGTGPELMTSGNFCNAGRADLAVTNYGSTTAYIYCNQIPAGGAVTGTLQVVNAVSSNAGIFVQGATGQTADLLDVYTNNNVLLDNINTSGDLCVALGQTCGGTSALQVNGTGSFGDTLNVGISNNDVALQANTTGTGNLLQLENSGSNVLTVDNTGDLAAGGSISLGTLGAATGDVLLCFNSSNQIAACSTSGGGGGSGGGAPFVQGGNSFGAEAVLGTNDDNSLALETNGTQRAVLDTSGNLTFQQSSTITAAANATANTLTLQGGAASGTDTAGGALNLNGGQGTGTGAGGNINFNIAPAGSSGSSLNAVGGTPVMSINGTTGAVTLENAVNTDAFQIQNASGTDLLDANTSSGSLTLGTPSANIWIPTTSLPVALQTASTAIYDGYIYQVSGYNGSRYQTVYYAPLNSNGSIGSWTAMSSTYNLPTALNGVSLVVYNGYLYALGGGTSGGATNTVYYAPLSTTGGLSAAWTTNSSTLPSGRLQGAAVAYNGYLYYYGGSNGTSVSSNVYYATINVNGSVGTFTTSSNSLTTAVQMEGAVVNDGYLYSIGGVTDYNGTSATNAVYYAQLNPSTGAVGTWTTSSNSLPVAEGGFGAAVVNDTVYAIAGDAISSVIPTVYYATLNSNGSTSSFSTAANTFPESVFTGGVATNGNYIYYVAGTQTWPGTSNYAAAYYMLASSLSSQGASYVQETQGSTTAFQVQDASNSDAIDIDTTNDRLGINTSAPTAKLDVETGASNDVSIIANTSGTGNLLQLENAGTNVLTVSSAGNLAVNGSGNGTTVGALFKNATNSTTAFEIQNAAGTSNLLVADTTDSKLGVGAAPSSTGSLLQVGGTLSVSTLGTTGTSVLCYNASDQVSSCGSAAGSGSYIYNQSASAQTANFDIAATSGIAAQIKGNASSDILDLLTSGGATVAQFTAGGNVNLGASGLASTLQIGNTTGAVAQTINLGNNGTASSTSTVTIGSLIGASTTTIQGGTGNILLSPDGASSTGVLVKPVVNSAAALQVQTASGATVLTANTVNQNVTVGYVPTGNPFSTTNTQSLTAGTTPTITTAGNFCNNGLADLAVTNGGSNTASIYCNTGSITAPFPATATMTLTTGANPYGITAGNFCNNGRTDLAVTNNGSSGTNGISAYCNTGSTGAAAFSSTSTMTLTTGSGPRIITAGNFCNNGLADLAVTNNDNSSGTTAYVYCNTGSAGSAAFSATKTISLNTGQGPAGMTAGNLCNNNLTDLVVTNLLGGTGTTAYVYCNTGSAGSAAFSATKTTSLTTGSGPASVTTGNFCNNSQTDLAITNYGSNTAYVYCNTGSAGSAAFSATKTTSLTTGTQPYGTAAGNLCGDGRADLAVTNYGSSGTNGISAYCNTGSTGAAAFSSTSTMTLTTGSGPYYMTTGNLCNANRADLAVANYGTTTVSIFCNQIPAGGAVTGTLQVNSAIAGNAGLLIQGAASQTADLLDVYDNNNVLLDNINASGDLCVALGATCNGTSALQVNGPALFETPTNSTTAFQIQNAAGTSNLFVADTTDSEIGINQTPVAAGAALQVTGGISVTTGGLAVTAGGETITAGGETIQSGGLNLNGTGITNAGAIQGATTYSGNNTLTLTGTGANELAVTGAPPASTSSSLVQFGNAITDGSANGTYIGLNAPSGNTADLLNLQNNGSVALQVSSAGALTTGSTINGQTIGSTASFTGTLTVGDLTNAGSTVLCETGGELGTCGSAAGSGSYIYNQSAGAQSANFDIQAVSGVAAQIQGSYGSDILDLFTSTNGSSPVASFGDDGQLTAVGVNAGSGLLQGTGGLNITGDSNFTGDIAATGGYTQTGSGANTFTGATTVSGALDATGTALFQNAADSTTAFQIQNAAGDTLLDADTTDQSLTVTGGSNPAQPVQVGSDITTGTSPWDVAISGNYAYVVDYTTPGALQVFNISNPADVTQVGSNITTGDNPYAVAISGNYAYVINQGSNTLQVFNISNPADVTQVGSDVTTGSDPDALAISGNYAYVTNQNGDDLQIFNISNPASVTQVGSDIATGSGPVSVAISGNYAYVIDSLGLQIFNISNPVSVTQVGSNVTTGTNPWDVAVSGNYAYVLNESSNDMQVFNISNPADVTQVGSDIATGSNPWAITISGNDAYVADTGSGDMQIFNISNPADVTQVGSNVTTDTNPDAIVISGNYAYVTNAGSYTMQVFNMNPSPTLQVNTSGGGNVLSVNATGAGNILTVSSPSTGGSVLNISSIGAVALQNTIDSTTAFQIQNAAGSALFTADTTDGELGIGAAPSAGGATLQVGGSVSLTALGASGDTVLCYDSTTDEISTCGSAAGSGSYIYNQSASAQSANFDIAAGSGVAATIEGASDSSDILDLLSNTGATVASVSSTGATTFQNSADSTTAFQIQDAEDDTLLTGDTTNMRLGVDVTYTSMSAPTDLSVGSPTSGGSLTPSTTYYYEVTAIDSAGGETTPSTEASGSTTSTNLTLPLTWTAVTGASGYRIYRSTTSGSEEYSTTVLTNSFTDAGSTTSSSTTTPPTSDTAYISASTASNDLELSVGGLGTPTGQLYVSGTAPTSVLATIPFNIDDSSMTIAGGYAYFSNGTIYNINNPAAPSLVQTSSITGGSSYVSGQYLYLGPGYYKNGSIYNISNPTMPVEVGTFPTPSNYSQAGGMYVEGDYAYLTTAGYFTIVNVSNPANPVVVSNLPIYGGSGVYVSGDYAYVESADGLDIFNISNPANPTLVSTAGTTGVGDVYVSGDYAYVESGGLTIFNISNLASPVQVGHIGISNTVGLAVQGRYAYVGANAYSGDSFYIVDISNPAKPVATASVPGTADTQSVAVQGRYAYVGTSEHGIQIYDLGGEYAQQLQAGGIETGTLQVDSDANISGDEAIQGSLNTGQSIQDGGSLGVSDGADIVGSMNLSGGNNILSSPSAPTVTPEGTTGSTAYTYTVTALNSSGGQTLASSAGTTTTGNATLSSTNYNQITWTAVSGATSYNIYRTAGGGSTGLVGSTSSTSFDDIGLSASGNVPTTNTTAQLTVQGAVLFKNAADSTTAFQIQDSSGDNVLTADTVDHSVTVTGGSNPAQPVQVGSNVATGTNPFSVAVSGNYAYVVNYGSNTLQVFNISNPASIGSAVSTVPTGTNPRSVAVSGNYAYVVNYSSSTLQVFNISNPVAVTRVGSVATGTDPVSIAVSGNYAYVIDGTSPGGLQVFNISNPAAVTQVGSTIGTGNAPSAIAVSGNYAYVVNYSSSTLQVFNISNPAAVTWLGSNIYTGTNPIAIAISGNYAYVVNETSSTLQVFNISNPAVVTQVGNVGTGSAPFSVAVSGNYAYVVNDDDPGTLQVFNISNPAAVTQVGSSVTTGDGPLSVAVSGNYAYVVNYDSDTLQAFNINPAQTLQVNNAAGSNILSVDPTGAGNLLTLNNGNSAAPANVLTLSNTGAATFENAVNSTTAFQIQNSSGSDIFDADTQDGWIGIGTSAPGNLLSIGALTTASSGAQIAVSTSGTTNSGIVVQDVASQSSGYAFQLQSSSGTSLASIDYQGNLAVQSATITGILTVNGHIVTGNTTGTTTATLQTGAGTGGSPACTVTGDDTAGLITLTTGTAGWAAGAQCTINFSADYAAAPHPVIAPASNTPTAAVSPYVTSTATTLTVNFINADTAQHTYTWNYFNAQ